MLSRFRFLLLGLMVGGISFINAFPDSNQQLLSVLSQSRTLHLKTDAWKKRIVTAGAQEKTSYESQDQQTKNKYQFELTNANGQIKIACDLLLTKSCPKEDVDCQVGLGLLKTNALDKRDQFIVLGTDCDFVSQVQTIDVKERADFEETAESGNETVALEIRAKIFATIKPGHLHACASEKQVVLAR